MAITHSAEYYTGVITTAYQKYLGRSPDANGLAYWLSSMQGGLTDEQLESGFLGSAEYIQNHGGAGAGWVDGMYQSLLGRSPTQAEADYWVNVLNGGTSTTDVAYSFAASPEREAQARHCGLYPVLGAQPERRRGFLLGQPICYRRLHQRGCRRWLPRFQRIIQPVQHKQRLVSNRRGFGCNLSRGDTELSAAGDNGDHA